MYLVDTSVWAEIFIGSQLGKRTKNTLDKGECFALDISFAELSKWCISGNFDLQAMDGLVEKSANGILNTSKKGFIRAGELWHSANKNHGKGRQVGLIDCIFAATAEENGLTMLTKDRHFAKFAGIKNEFI